MDSIEWKSLSYWLAVARKLSIRFLGVGLLALANHPCFADSVEPDAALIKLTRSAAYRTPRGQWQPAHNLEIGTFVSGSPHRLWLSGSDRLDLYVNTSQFGASIPAECRETFVLPWPELRKQRAAKADAAPAIFPWKLAFDTEAQVAFLASFRSGSCSLDLLITQRLRPFDSAFPGWRRFEGVPEEMIERFGAKEKLAMWGELVQLNFVTDGGERVGHGFFVPFNEAATTYEGQPFWAIVYFLVGMVATHVLGLYVIGPMLAWLASLITSRGRKATWFGIQLFIAATFSYPGLAWFVERYRALTHKPIDRMQLVPVSEIRNPQALVVVVTGTWNTETSQQKLFAFANQVTAGMAVDVKLFVWSGRNSEAARMEAGLALAERLKQLSSADYPKLFLMGFSHGGNVARVAVSELGAAAANARIFLLGTPTLSIQRRPFNKVIRNVSLHGAGLISAICGTSFVGCIVMWFVQSGWVDLELTLPVGILMTIALGLGFNMWADTKRPISYKFRRLLARGSITSHPLQERQIAFAEDNVLKAYKNLNSLLQKRQEAEMQFKENARQTASPRLPKTTYQVRILLVELLAFFLFSRYWPTPGEWFQSYVVSTGACILLATVTAQLMALVLWRRQMIGVSLSVASPGAVFFHSGMSQLANVVGLHRFGYGRYDIELVRGHRIDDVLHPTDAGDIGRLAILRNWHGALVTAPLAVKRIAEILNREIAPSNTS